MGRKSTKEDKNIYFTSRENAGLTREAAAEKMITVSSDRIEKIENDKSLPHPDEILVMAEAYKNPSLCNYYCSHECPIGQEYVPEIQVRDFGRITLEMLSTLNTLTKEKDRLIEIAADGEITEDEIPDFLSISENLDRMALAIDSLKLWVDHTIAEGKLDSKLMK